MRPDRIVVGEVRSGEAVDMLQAMSSGAKTMGTIHANAPIDALSRLEVMCLMAGLNMPIRAIREQISSSVDLIVHMSRMRDGSRRIVAVSEVTGLEGDRITLSDLFMWEQTGRDGEGKILGIIEPTGLEPQRLNHLFDAAGIHLPPSMFISSRPAVMAHRASTEPSAPAEPEDVDYAPPDEVPGVQEEAGLTDMGEAALTDTGEAALTDMGDPVPTDDSYP
jgi:pilus assembly protein CpaF